jgi:hypothetical protein
MERRKAELSDIVVNSQTNSEDISMFHWVGG